MSSPALHEVRKIAVFRPNAVGDFMFALPALHALRCAYRDAEIVYVGRAWHQEFLCGRPGPIDRVVVLPPVDILGRSAPASRAHAGAVADFIGALREECFDIALQMYGGGQQSNPVVKAFEARLTVGMRAPDAESLSRSIPFGRAINRRLQLLEVAALAGANAWPMGDQLAVTGADARAAAQLVLEDAHRPLVVVQPGASDARRQWPAPRFAAVGDALAAMGAQVIVNGTELEAPLVRSVIEAMKRPAVDLSGKASLSALCGLLARASLVVSNDTGPLHMALALGRPSVGIYWFTNFIESAPLRQQGHRGAISTQLCCPVCGARNVDTRCAHNVSFVDEVTLGEVLDLSSELIRENA